MLIRMSLGLSQLLDGLAARLRREEGQTMAEYALLLALTLFLSVFTFGSGRTNILAGLVHLVVFATFIFLVFVP